MKPESLAEALKRLNSAGYQRDLRARGGRLRDPATEEIFDPEILEVAETLRFEGESDPSEQVILFALRAADGAPLGCYSSVFGPGTPPEDVSVVRSLGARNGSGAAA